MIAEFVVGLLIFVGIVLFFEHWRPVLKWAGALLILAAIYFLWGRQ